MQEMKNCQFCGSDNLDMAELYDPMRTPVKQKYVQCKHCGACGPLSGTYELAIQKWNSRIQEAPEMPQEKPTIVDNWEADEFCCPFDKDDCKGCECMLWVYVGKNAGRCGLVNTMYINSTGCGA